MRCPQRPVGHDYPPASRDSPPLPKNLVIGKRFSAPIVAPMSRTRLFSASEARCQSEGCAKLLTLRIAENYSQDRCDCGHRGSTATIKAGNDVTVF
jgi:hypothetical protein